MTLHHIISNWGHVTIDTVEHTIEFWNEATNKTRIYDIPKDIQLVETDNGYITIEYETNKLIFKLEENDCLVGDKFDDGMNHIGEFAAWDFINDYA